MTSFPSQLISNIVITAHIFAEIRNRKQQIDAMRRVIQLLPQVRHYYHQDHLRSAHSSFTFPGQSRHDVRPPELPPSRLSEQRGQAGPERRGPHGEQDGLKQPGHPVRPKHPAQHEDGGRHHVARQQLQGGGEDGDHQHREDPDRLQQGAVRAELGGSPLPVRQDERGRS